MAFRTTKREGRPVGLTRETKRESLLDKIDVAKVLGASRVIETRWDHGGNPTARAAAGSQRVRQLLACVDLEQALPPEDIRTLEELRARIAVRLERVNQQGLLLALVHRELDRFAQEPEEERAQVEKELAEFMTAKLPPHDGTS